MLKHRTIKASKAILLTLCVAFAMPQTLFAGGDSDDFNAGDMIIHHVTDAYDIHLMDIGEHAISIPLPIILYSNDDGLSVFMSSAFHHGQAAKNRYILDHGHIYRLGENNPQASASEELDAAEALAHGYNEMSWGGFFAGEPGAFIDLSITKTTTGIFLTVFIMLIVFISIARSYGKRQGQAPSGLQSFMEPLILFVRDEIAKPSIGPKYERFMPYLLTVFFFIWAANMLGLIPFIGGFNVTGNLAVTAILALFTFIITTVNGNKHYWAHVFAPGVPVALYPLMIPIEIMGLFIKPIVLCARLFANITAGHIIILSFISLIFIFSNLYGTGAGFGASIVSLMFAIFMNVLELLVAFLQAYVFTLLSALYFSAAVEEHH